MREALMVVVIGRKRPVASANPVTVPLASSGRASETIAHTPDVPIDTDTSPGPSERPRAAPMLSPVPAAMAAPEGVRAMRSEEHTSELQSRGHLVCRLLLEKKKSYADSKAAAP